MVRLPLFQSQKTLGNSWFLATIEFLDPIWCFVPISSPPRLISTGVGQTESVAWKRNDGWVWGSFSVYPVFMMYRIIYTVEIEVWIVEIELLFRPMEIDDHDDLYWVFQMRSICRFLGR